MRILPTVMCCMLGSSVAFAKLPGTYNVFGVPANDPQLDQLDILQMPAPDTDGKIPTMNKTGFMTHDYDPFSLEFIEEAAKSPYPALEIGAAYGISTLPVLEKGGAIIANDVDPNHLLILKDRTPVEQRENLYLNTSSFPDEMEFPDNSFDAILICRVLHLFTPEALEESFDKLHKWLRPGGRVYITTMTPFHHGLKGFLQTYEDRWEQGEAWPGVISNLDEYFPKIKAHSPGYAHVMDERPLLKALQQRGFNIDHYSYYDYDRPDKSKRTGREYFGIIALKI